MLVLEIVGYDPDSDVGESYVGVEPTKMHQITMLLVGLVAKQTQHRVFEVATPRRASCRSFSMKRKRRRSTTRKATAPVCRPAPTIRIELLERRYSGNTRAAVVPDAEDAEQGSLDATGCRYRW